MDRLDIRPTITASEIADLTGTKPTTVSTWRRRYTDDDNNPFPAPVEGSSEARPLFDFEAIAQWYAQQYPEKEPLNVTGHAAQAAATNLVNALRSETSPETARRWLIAAIAASAMEADAARGVPVAWNGQPMPTAKSSARQAITDAPPWLPADLRQALTEVDANSDVVTAVAEYVARMPRDRALRVVEELVTNPLLARATSSSSSTSDSLAALLTGLVDGDPRTVLDPACGTGSLLFHVAELLPNAELTGVDVDATSVTIARCRAYLTGTDVTFITADSLQWLSADATFDLVVIDPPFGVTPDRQQTEHLSTLDRTLGQLIAGNGDIAWLTIAAHAIRKGGLGCVLVPGTTLYRDGASAKARHALLTRGQVEAVIALPDASDTKLSARRNDDPRRIRQDTRIPLAVWLLRAPDTIMDAVTLVDGDAFVGQTSQETVERLIHAMTMARGGAVEDGVVRVAALRLLQPDKTMVPADWRPREDDSVTVATRNAALNAHAADYSGAMKRHLPTELPGIAVAADGFQDLVPLSDVGQVFTGKYVRSENMSDAPGNGLIATVGVGTEVRYVPRPSGSARLLKTGDVLVNIHQGGAVVWSGEREAIPNAATMVVRVSTPRYTPDFIAECLSAQIILERGLRGLGIKRLDPRTLRVPTVPMELQRVIVTVTRELESAAETLAAAHHAVDRYRDALRDLIALGAVETVEKGRGVRA